MRAIGRVMSGEMPEGEGPGVAVALLLKEHAVVLGRVGMALLGDAARVERALEDVAREAGSKGPPNEVKPLVWLLGLLRAASAVQLTKVPLRSRAGAHEAPPATQALGVAEAMSARSALAALPPTEREAVVLSLVGGLEAVDVAGACNVEVGAARARLARGLEQLSRTLASESERGES